MKKFLFLFAACLTTVAALAQQDVKIEFFTPSIVHIVKGQPTKSLVITAKPEQVEVIHQGNTWKSSELIVKYDPAMMSFTFFTAKGRVLLREQGWSTLVFSLTDRSAIFQTDDVWNKRSNNDRVLYEYTQYQRYGYLEFVNFTAFSKAKWAGVYGDSFDSSKEYTDDRNVIQKVGDDYLKNQTVQEFIQYYESRGYTIVRLDPIRYSTGAKQLKPGGTGYLLATKEKLIIVRLWDYIKGFFTFETKRDVDDPELTDRYIRFEKDPYSGLFAIVGSGTTHKYLLYFDGKFPFIHQNWIHMNLGVSFTRYRGQEISSVITDSQGDLKTTRQQYPNQIGTDQWADTAIDFHTLTYNTGELTENEKQLFPDKYTNARYRRDGLSMIGTSFLI